MRYQIIKAVAKYSSEVDHWIHDNTLGQMIYCVNNPIGCYKEYETLAEFKREHHAVKLLKSLHSKRGIWECPVDT